MKCSVVFELRVCPLQFIHHRHEEHSSSVRFPCLDMLNLCPHQSSLLCIKLVHRASDSSSADNNFVPSWHVQCCANPSQTKLTTEKREEDSQSFYVQPPFAVPPGIRSEYFLATFAYRQPSSLCYRLKIVWFYFFFFYIELYENTNNT